MPIQAQYMGMALTIEDVDSENRAFFAYCAAGEFRLQRSQRGGLLRYPPTTACPWTGERESTWVAVEGRGTVHSYGAVLRWPRFLSRRFCSHRFRLERNW